MTEPDDPQLPWWRRDISDLRLPLLGGATPDATYSRADLCAETDRRRCDHAAHKQVGDQVHLYGIITSITVPAGSLSSSSSSLMA